MHYYMIVLVRKMYWFSGWSNLWSCSEEREYHTMVKRERDDEVFLYVPVKISEAEWLQGQTAS